MSVSSDQDSGSEKLIIVCIPSLVATLLKREREKGSPLTEEEVIQIRDNSPAEALTPAELRAVEERRGYKDIDPEHCWEQWQEARLELFEEEEGEADMPAVDESVRSSSASGSELIVFIHPSLVGLLYAREQEKGSPLTEEEVLRIRDNSDAIVLTPEDVREREAARGFKDIDPECCWEEWQEVRLKLLNAPQG